MIASLILGFALPILAESPKSASFEIGGGTLTPTGAIVETVYGTDEREPVFHLRNGLLFWSILDLGASIDFCQITGRRIGTIGGEDSAEVSRLTLVPIAATALVRLDVFPNQPLVPYGGGGIAYLVWSERSPADDESVDGDKYGWTGVAGVQILLDWMEPDRAADVDGFWGVNDTYLNVELSRTQYDRLGRGNEGLDLSHWTGRATFMFAF